MPIMKFILLSTIFDFFNTLFLLIFIFAILFIIIVILVVLKLLRSNVNTKIDQQRRYENSINARVRELESPPIETVEEAKECKYCGAIMDGKAVYCENCGSKILE